jgi:hypothetical protein
MWLRAERDLASTLAMVWHWCEDGFGFNTRCRCKW